ncbi:aminotransferase class III-fold pyridoxal phosphate-dependent enzyme [Cytobacillus firmus]|uniref:aminotransferase class III-fold pyridoxal phosphate-dependent enzyme n=1 Tax=Cytobacillus firmus TaxID=1399 RepID=UPI002162F5F8|nr:aminotransferase class III-fold pyridoxal phosphate-dependent enzyme [Cytobacillus firmus]MCS0674059.1 aminotransferase class III-fold pyridoxal phosphate-dependent enzyme [Cytobacillus firmus]
MILAILQVRVSSTRLPAKVLKPIFGKPMFLHQYERIKRSKLINKIVIATSDDMSDNPIEELCIKNSIDYYRGNLHDVLDRFYQTAIKYKPQHIVRLTGDCPLMDPNVIDTVIETHLNGKYDYTSNTLEPTYPDGLDVEIFTYQCLIEAYKMASLPSHREHVTPYIYDKNNNYKLKNVSNIENLNYLRWTVDEELDFQLVNKIFEELYFENPEFSYRDILKLIVRIPELKTVNAHFNRNEGFGISRKNDLIDEQQPSKKITQNRYIKSQNLLNRSRKSIPLGAQTFSKSITHFPEGVSPHFIEYGNGSRVWDIDGNEYIDFSSSLAAITLGYNDIDVNNAVKNQLEKGSIFSLSHPIEVEVAEKLIEMVPCAEMVRFGKSGSDATAGAIRLARAYTGRDHVAICGYHGWQDWYIGATSRNRGIPKSTAELTHFFQFNNIESLEKIFKNHQNNVAAVILEPMNTEFPQNNFLQLVQELSKKNGTVLIFDEMITGFRFSNGGAQEYFGVTPDLATFGKGIANGFPLSAVAGKAEIMKLMEEVFFSFTFGGETLSLAASLATLKKLQHEPIIKQMRKQGQKLMEQTSQILNEYGMKDLVRLSGDPVWSFIHFNDTHSYSQWEIKTLFLQEVFKRGVLTTGTHNISYSHTDEDLSIIKNVYQEVFLLLKKAINEGNLYEYLETKPIEPLFKLR